MRNVFLLDIVLLSFVIVHGNTHRVSAVELGCDVGRLRRVGDLLSNQPRIEIGAVVNDTRANFDEHRSAAVDAELIES